MLKNFTWCEHFFAKPTGKKLSIVFINFYYFVPWATICYLILRLMLLVSMCNVVCLERISSIGPESTRLLCTLCSF